MPRKAAPPLRVETAPGVVCERISVPIRAVGLYVPAGSAPLPSTAVMLAVPAAIAGCPVRVDVHAARAPTAPRTPAVLVAARKAGVEQVFKAGGAQAIAAMAYGTATIPKCDKVFGPGNAFVTAAKMLVAQDAAGAAADLPAGVTEVMVIADDSARGRLRRRGSARAGRTQSRCAGPARHDLRGSGRGSRAAGGSARPRACRGRAILAKSIAAHAAADRR